MIGGKGQIRFSARLHKAAKILDDLVGAVPIGQGPLPISQGVVVFSQADLHEGKVVQRRDVLGLAFKAFVELLPSRLDIAAAK